MAAVIEELANEQRKRCVGQLMSGIERVAYSHLDANARSQLRSSVLSAIGSYHGFVLDLIRASESGDAMPNAEYLRVMIEVRDQQAQLLDRLEAV